METLAEEYSTTEQIEISKVPFEWDIQPDFTNDICIVLVDTESPSGFLFEKGAICSIGAMHEAEGFKRVWHTKINPYPYVEPRIVRYDTPHAWSSRCVQLHGIKPSDVRYSPGLKETLEKFYNWASLHYTLNEV